MKKIITPQIREEAVYYSDFSGKCLGNIVPTVEVTINFNYGSEYDGSSITLHLSDQDAKLLISTIKNHISEEYKQMLSSKIAKSYNKLDDAIAAREPEQCTLEVKSINALKNLL